MIIFVLLQDFFIEFLIGGQYRRHKVLAIDSVQGIELHTAAGLAVVKQKAVAVHAVAALSAGKLSDLCRLFSCQFQDHFHHLQSNMIRITKELPQICGSSYQITSY